MTRELTHIRKPYLSMDPHPSPLRWGASGLDLSAPEGTWSEVKHLTNEERDQIDLQARMILARCADRVKVMEALERRAVCSRAHTGASGNTSCFLGRVELASKSFNPVVQFLQTRLGHGDSTILLEYIAAHHSSITWYLNRRLAEASQSQKSMQEERVKRQLERTRTLGSSATREAMAIGTRNVTLEKKNVSPDSWLEGASSVLVSGFAATLGASSYRLTKNEKPSSIAGSATPDDSENEDIELTQSQILQFETENANILRSVQDTLESVQQAEARLMDISNLQTELVTHLTHQTELTDQLYEDAMATTSAVERGNVQLREARRRAKDSRVFILVFLIGASLSLLFLHFY